jgi:hypothetical protein
MRAGRIAEVRNPRRKTIAITTSQGHRYFFCPSRSLCSNPFRQFDCTVPKKREVRDRRSAH